MWVYTPNVPLYRYAYNVCGTRERELAWDRLWITWSMFMHACHGLLARVQWPVAPTNAIFGAPSNPTCHVLRGPFYWGRKGVSEIQCTVSQDRTTLINTWLVYFHKVVCWLKQADVCTAIAMNEKNTQKLDIAPTCNLWYIFTNFDSIQCCLIYSK